jgi:arabinan endo-1,5-alpha-L-arabinosidase
LVSDDGWTWRSGTAPSITGLAPDVIHIGDRYYLYVATQPVQPVADNHLLSTKSLDPASPDYGWEDGGIVASSDGIEDCNGIDPGAFLDPTTGRLWLTYGSYFGYIRLVELDPKTGKRLHPGDKPVDLAVNCEASVLTYHDGWYYLLATHGSCCAGASSGYNIRMGRSKSVTGPYLDHDGLDMIKGGGKLFLGSESRLVGPGHFGRLVLDQEVEVFSCHYEADLDHPGGFGTLAIRPLLWRDGWPVAGQNAKAGNYMIESVRTGTVMELAVEGVSLGGGRAGGARGGAPGGRGGRGGGGAAAPIPPQDVAVVSQRWPAGNVAPRMANYLDQAQQKWTVAPAPHAGGEPGAA